MRRDIRDNIIRKQEEEIRVLNVILDSIDKKVNGVTFFNYSKSMRMIKYYLKKGKGFIK